jgi:hypothetical protein
MGPAVRTGHVPGAAGRFAYVNAVESNALSGFSRERVGTRRVLVEPGQVVRGVDFGNERDNAPPTDIHLSAASVRENEPAGTLVGTFSSTDPDTGQIFTYILVPGDGDADNNAFTIVGDQLQTTASFNYADSTVFYVLPNPGISADTASMPYQLKNKCFRASLSREVIGTGVSSSVCDSTLAAKTPGKTALHS